MEFCLAGSNKKQKTENQEISKTVNTTQLFTPSKRGNNDKMEGSQAPRIISLVGGKKPKTEQTQSLQWKKKDEIPKPTQPAPRVISLSGIKTSKFTEDEIYAQSVKKPERGNDSQPKLQKHSSQNTSSRFMQVQRSVSLPTTGKDRSFSADGVSAELREALWLDRLAKREAETKAVEVSVAGLRYQALPKRKSRAEMRQERLRIQEAWAAAPSALRSIKEVQQTSAHPKKTFQTNVGIPSTAFHSSLPPKISLAKDQRSSSSKKLPQGCISIDGSLMEGGGQLIRNSIALSAISGVPVYIENVRGGRGASGLRPQHMVGIELVQQISSGCTAQGVTIGSETVLFVPGMLKSSKKFIADPGTAGSIALLVQIALPCLLFCKNEPVSNVKMRGGTTVPFAPPVDHFPMVLYQILRKFGVRCNFKVVKRGYFPKGGGEVTMTVQAIETLTPVVMTEQGQLIKIQAGVFCNHSPDRLQHMYTQAEQVLQATFPGVEIIVTKLYDGDKDNFKSVTGKGATWGLQLSGETSTGCFIGADSFGDANNLQSGLQHVEKACRILQEVFESGACTDEHTADQLIVFMALASGTSRIRIPKNTLQVSKHLETTIYISKLFLGCEFSIQDDTLFPKSVVVECNGRIEARKP